MSPSLRKTPLLVLAAMAAMLALPSQGSASIGTVVVGATKVPPRYCSGAFRYAARLGNTEIITPAPAQVFAADRRFYRMLRRASTGDDGIPPLHSRTAMCG
jgi:hypothetical protein